MGNNDREQESPTLSFQVFLAIVLAVCFLLALLGNLIMLVCISVSPTMQRKVYNLLILSLAAGDFVMACTAHPLLAIYFVFHWPSWTWPDPVCKMAAFIFETCTTAAVAGTVMLALECYFYIARDKTMPRKTLALVLVFLWVASASLSAPFLILKGITIHSDKFNQSSCHHIHSGKIHNHLYVSAQISKTAVAFCLLLVCLFCVGSSLSAIITKQKKPSLIPDKIAKVRKQKRKSLKLTLAILISTILCLMPYWITLLYRLTIPQAQVKAEVLFLAYGIAVSRPVLVPAITCLLSTRFRNAYLEILRIQSCTSGKMRKSNSSESNLTVDPLNCKTAIEEADCGKMTYQAFLRHGSQTLNNNERKLHDTCEDFSGNCDSGSDGRDNDSFNDVVESRL